jgi:hypothetical protein
MGLPFFAPLVTRFEHEVGVGDVGIHGIGGDLGGADAGEDFLHLGEVAADDGLALLLQLKRGGQTGAAAADELEGEVALVELRDELGAEACEDPERGAEHHEHGQHDERLETQAEVQQRRVEALGEGDEPVVFLLNLATEQIGAQHGHQGDGEHERTTEREHDDERHGLEHLPFDALQREDGQHLGGSGIGGGFKTAQLARDGCDLGRGGDDRVLPGHDALDFLETGLRHHHRHVEQAAFIERRHELFAKAGDGIGD